MNFLKQQKGVYMQTSILMPYSYAIAAENLELTDDNDSTTKGSIAYKPNRFLEVTLTEKLPFYHGEVNSEQNEYQSKTKENNGKVNDETVKYASSVKAKWLARGQGNRITPPNVRRGEKLLVHRLGQTDQYFWETIENDNHLRKLETVIWVFSATQDESKQIDIDHCYILEVSTHSKRIRLTTSSDNGEPFKYTIDLDTNFGALTIFDDIDNVIKLESKPKRILLRNADNSFLHIAGNSIHMNSNEEVKITTSKLNVEASSYIYNKTPQVTDDAKVTVTGEVLHQSMTTLNGLTGL